MGSTRRAFTPEYKEQSVAFVTDGGRSVAEVSRNIGVHEMTLGRWVKVARDAAESGKNPDAPLGESERPAAVLGGAEQMDPGAVGAAGTAGGLAIYRHGP